MTHRMSLFPVSRDAYMDFSFGLLPSLTFHRSKIVIITLPTALASKIFIMVSASRAPFLRLGRKKTAVPWDGADLLINHTAYQHE